MYFAFRLVAMSLRVCVEELTSVFPLSTDVLKDFLRELPEPVCTSAIYQMLMDALGVQVQGDADGNARLMLGILDCLPQVNQVGIGGVP